MRSFLLRAAITAAALVGLGIALPDVHVPSDVVQLAGLAAVFGVVNAFVRPVVHLLAFPLKLATLGLVAFLVNGALFLGVAWAAGQLGIPFSIGGFPPDLTLEAIGLAIVSAAILGAVSTAASLLVPDL
jgi:putative membrane protein